MHAYNATINVALLFISFFFAASLFFCLSCVNFELIAKWNKTSKYQRTKRWTTTLRNFVMYHMFIFTCRYQCCSCLEFSFSVRYTVNMWEASICHLVEIDFCISFCSIQRSEYFLNVKRHSNHTFSHVKCSIQASVLSIDANPNVRIFWHRHR